MLVPLADGSQCLTSYKNDKVTTRQQIARRKYTPRNSFTYSLCVLFADLRILVMLLLDTLPMLGNVLLLCFFVFFIFGIVGVQLWAGLLRQRCVLELPDNISFSVTRYTTRLSLSSSILLYMNTRLDATFVGQ